MRGVGAPGNRSETWCNSLHLATIFDTCSSIRSNVWGKLEILLSDIVKDGFYLKSTQKFRSDCSFLANLATHVKYEFFRLKYRENRQRR